MPGFIAPALPTLRTRPRASDHWVHEIAYGGDRVQAHLDAGRVALYDPSGEDCGKRYESIAADIARLPANKLILDGEAVGVDTAGMPRQTRLKNPGARRTRRLIYFVFDLLFMDGFDLRAAPLIERKQVLEKFLQEARPARTRYNGHLAGPGARILAEACRMQLPGIVSKRGDAPYRSGRRAGWETLKCRAARA